MTHTQACRFWKEIQCGGEGELDQCLEQKHNRHFQSRYTGGQFMQQGILDNWTWRGVETLLMVRRHLNSTHYLSLKNVVLNVCVKAFQFKSLIVATASLKSIKFKYAGKTKESIWHDFRYLVQVELNWCMFIFFACTLYIAYKNLNHQDQDPDKKSSIKV